MTGSLFLVAEIGGHAVAFPSDVIGSVVDLGAVTPVPRTGPEIVGLATLRSRVVTVVDPCVALGIPGRGARPAGNRNGGGGRAIVVEDGGHHYALLVDTLDDVAEFDCLPLDPAITLGGGWAAAAQGLIVRGSDPVLVLSPAALLAETAVDQPATSALTR